MNKQKPIYIVWVAAMTCIRTLLFCSDNNQLSWDMWVHGHVTYSIAWCLKCSQLTPDLPECYIRAVQQWLHFSNIRFIVPTVAICRGTLRWLQFMVELHCRVLDIGLMQQRCVIIHILFSVFVLATVVLGGVTFLSSTRGHGCPTDVDHGTISRLIWSPSLWVSSVSFLTSGNLASCKCCSTLVLSGYLCVFSDRR